MELKEEIPFVSKIVSAPKQIRRPSDLLAERQSYMRRILRDQPSVEQLLKHAERFGTDQVPETAAELGYGAETLERIIDKCDLIDAAEFRKLHPHGKTPRGGKSAEERAKLLIGDDEVELENGTGSS